MSGETKHTRQHAPGPWSVDKPFQEPGIYVQAKSTALVCKVYHMNDGIDEANARLIAAAPALYKTLRELSNAVAAIRTGNRDGATFGALSAADDKARTALALVHGTNTVGTAKVVE